MGKTTLLRGILGPNAAGATAPVRINAPT